ncbi:hypothetical protein [Streptomyces sp. NPDC093094]|uniref:hypothetical protein n=1 Tax=Streptomyces sp. NPDC093094 TaxID=3366026 RepID=UPI0038272B95
MRSKTMEEAPAVGMPLDPAEPAAGCDVCQALARERTAATARQDWSKVSDLNVEMRNHHEKRARAWTRRAQ